MPFIELKDTEVKSKGRNGVFQAARAAVRFGAKDTVCLAAWSKRAISGMGGEAPVMLMLSLDDAEAVGRHLLNMGVLRRPEDGLASVQPDEADHKQDWWTVITMDDATGNMVAVTVQERNHDAAMASVSRSVRDSEDRDEHGTLVVCAIRGKVPVMPPCESGATAYAVDLAGDVVAGDLR